MAEFRGAPGHYRIWKPEGTPSTTPAFDFNQCEWRLEFKLYSYYFSLELVNVKMSGQFRPFKVTCVARGCRIGSQELFGNFLTDCKFAATYHIWKCCLPCFYKKTGSSTWCTDAEFVVVFYREFGSPFNMNSADGACTNTILDLQGLSSDIGNLLVSGDAADVQLRCKGITRSAHRSVLAARSEVFSAIFRNKMVESTSGVVDISDLDEVLLDLFLRYIYTGNISDVPEGRMQELYAVADKYAVHSLKELCSAWMIQNLSADNYQEFLYIANQHSDRKLIKDLIASITDHPPRLQQPTRLQFCEKDPKLANEICGELFYKPHK